MFVNFTPDSQPYGLLGYFWAVNNFKRTAGSSQFQYSNESLSFYMDTETLYLGGANGLTTQISTLSHEFIHMINFYQRGALKGSDYMFDTFLEEMSALMSEDILAERLTPGTNPMRDGRITGWMSKPGFNCDLASWASDVNATCFGYNVTGSLGAYLLRQHGVGFYQQMLRNTSSPDSLQVLGNAIAQAGGPSLPVTLQRWGSNIALLPSSGPAGYGWPARTDQGFTLVGIDGQRYAAARRLPATVPAQLAARGHFPSYASRTPRACTRSSCAFPPAPPSPPSCNDRHDPDIPYRSCPGPAPAAGRQPVAAGHGLRRATSTSCNRTGARFGIGRARRAGCRPTLTLQGRLVLRGNAPHEQPVLQTTSGETWQLQGLSAEQITQWQRQNVEVRGQPGPRPAAGAAPSMAQPQLQVQSIRARP